jgi:hypothetical protein
MALFPSVDATYTFNGKSHTNLVVSEGDAPSEKWIVASDNAAEPFIYEFGPQYNQTVVLAKGKLVELGAPEFDYNTSRNVTTIKQASANSKGVVGVNHHNIYDMRRDRFSGNNQPNPTVITRSYIEVPLFEHAVSATAAGFAKAMKFGAAYGTNDANILKPGDYVKVGQDGNFVKVDTSVDSPFEVVGQVFNIEREVPPAGFLQYYLNMDIPELEAWLKASGTAPSPGTNPDSSAAAYPYGAPYANKGWLPNFNMLLNPIINKGIPFLTDGYFKAKTVVNGIALNDIYDATSNNDGHIENVRFAGDITFGHDVSGTFTPSTGNAVDAGVQVAADSHNNAVFIKLRHMIDRAEPDAIVVKLDGVAVDPKDVVVDMTHYQLNSNVIVVYLKPGITVKNLTIDAKLVVDPVAGIPTEWDYQGSVGAVRILLQK